MIAHSVIPRTAPPTEETARLLIIKDSPAVAAEVRAALQDYDVESCEGHDPILEHAAIFAPDLFILAATSAEEAFELCGMLRSAEVAREAPLLLAVSNPVSEAVAAKALSAGIDDIVVAGRAMELRARVHVQLRHKRDRDRLTRVRAERDTYHREAKTDPLTGISNRRTFDARLAAESADYALAFVDVDHFKKINDTLGHDVGDIVLRAIARCLYETKAPGDMVARYGGEEFVALLPACDAPQARERAERMRTAVEKLELPALQGKRVTVSIGIACRLRDEAGLVVCRRADEALYRAKQSGRNRVTVASASEREGTASEVEQYLQRALASGRAGLPLLPAAAREALRLAQDPATDVARIARLVDRDPALAARFLALASSAAYSGRVQPRTTNAAIVRIGLTASRDLLLQAVYQQATNTIGRFGESVARCFERSVSCAFAAQLVAPFVVPKYDLGYLCGLLHNVGEARIYRILSNFSEPIEDDHAEALVARHHEVAGAEIARVWRLPDDIVVACASHHDPASTAAPVRVVRAATALVSVAFTRADADEARAALLEHAGTSERVDMLADSLRSTIAAR